MNFSEEQIKIIEAPAEEKSIVIAAAAAGKALENGSLLYGVNGPFPIEKAKVGEKIYGEDGKLHTIIGVYPQGKKKKYLVEFSDRTVISCCNEHLWTFQTNSQRGKKSKTWNTKTLQEIIDHYPLKVLGGTKGRNNIFIPMTEPICFEKKSLPIEPYTLGALLGDGTLGDRGKLSRFTNEDEDVLQFVSDGLNKIGYQLVHRQNYDYAITQKQRSKIGKLTLILEELGLNNCTSENKFIPNIYKYSAVEDRLALLQGIIDTDGYCEGNAYDIALKSKQLIMDIKEICESLGLTAVYSIKNAVCTNGKNGRVDCGKVYRLRIKTSKKIPKIHRSQKRESQWKPTKIYSHRAIINITPTNEDVEMTCIKVDNPSSLFVTNNFVVTHNTAVLTERVRYLLKSGIAPERMVCLTFTNNAAEEMRLRLAEDFKDGLFIGTIHSYANYLLQSQGYETVECIANEEFDELFNMVMQHPEVIKPVDYLLCDESQDLNEQQYIFITTLINPKACLFVGDTRQSIYGFNGADPKLLEKMMYDDDYVIYELTQNYRNGKVILEYSNRIANKMKSVKAEPMKCMRERQGSVRGIKPADVFSILSSDTDWSKWAILCRSNRKVDSIMRALKVRGIPTITFKQGANDLNSLKEKVNANQVKVLTIHSAKGLQFDNVIVFGMRFATKNEEEMRVNYVAVTRARNELYLVTER